MFIEIIIIIILLNYFRDKAKQFIAKTITAATKTLHIIVLFVRWE